MNKNLVSIIIPTYNRSHLIGETLDSIIAQTHQNWECIVVDDRSTDYTKEILEFYLENDYRIQYYQRPKDRPKGANACRNFGFEKSKGEFVNWFDSDDIMLPDFLFTKLKAVQGKVDLIITGGFLTNSVLEEKKLINLSIETENLFKDFVLWRQNIFTPSVMFRKRILLGKKLFDPKLVRGQEADFFSRIFFEINSNSCIIINKPLFLYRHHLETKTQENLSYNPQYINSRIYIAKMNFERGFHLEDNEIINYFFTFLVDLFFLSLKHRDKHNSSQILKIIVTRLRLKHQFAAVHVFVLGQISMITKREFHVIRRQIKSYQWN